MITIRWSAAFEDDEGLVVRNHEYLATDWFDCEYNAEVAVRELIEKWCDSDTWNDVFGNYSDDGVLIVTLTEPPSVAGKYEVSLERVVKASAKRIETQP